MVLLDFNHTCSVLTNQLILINLVRYHESGIDSYSVYTLSRKIYFKLSSSQGKFTRGLHENFLPIQ